MTAKTLVVTGTDTGVGKTTVACALIRQARTRKMKVCGFKPVATGCAVAAGGLRNADALALIDAAGVDEPYERINPYAYAPAIAPHLAAQEARRPIRVERLDQVHAELAQRHELLVLEGAGGWKVPLDETWSFDAWVAEHEWPVLLVVGMRLGCLNHALLAAESIARETRLVGWVANVLPPEMPRLDDNIEALRRRLSAPCWGVLPAGAQRFAGTETSRALAKFAVVERSEQGGARN
jgi:dethiobiotin synthetase